MGVAVQLIDVGLQPYADVLALQESCFNQLVDNKINSKDNTNFNKLIICEHLPVITLGKSAKEENILISKELLAINNIDVFFTNRGGDVTLHSPNQLVGYPILDLSYFSTDLRWYMYQLEEVIIQTLEEYGILGYRIEGATGVWVNSSADNNVKKIASLGVKTSRWITMHGFSINISNDLSLFNLINPCGFTDKGVTSIEWELKSAVDKDAVKKKVVSQFQKIFNIIFL